MPESRFSIVEQVIVAQLQWNSIPMDRSYDPFRRRYMEVLCDSRDSLVYAMEGKHAAYPTPVVLYIGKTEAQRGQRPCDTAYARFYGRPGILSSIYSDMTLRWAIVPNVLDADARGCDIPSDTAWVQILERILIHAMIPALNSTHADGYLPNDSRFRKLVVCNMGDKGLLLPVVYGDYYLRKEDWE